MKKLVLIGAGGFAKTIADLAFQNRKYSEILFLDDNCKDSYVQGLCSDYLKFNDENTEMYPAFGNNEMRLKWLDILEKAGIVVPSFIHLTAYVSPTAKLGKANVVLPKAVINTNCRIERGCIINCGAVLDHDCILEEGVHLCIGALVKAENHLPSRLKIEAGQVIVNRQYPL
jgi:UDP-N-acetylbacillosamine N-acetyltransferase